MANVAARTATSGHNLDKIENHWNMYVCSIIAIRKLTYSNGFPNCAIKQIQKTYIFQWFSLVFIQNL